MTTEIEELYARFARLWANSHPVRSAAELEAALRACGLEHEDASDDWLRSLSRDWVYHESDDPFTDAAANRAYRRELSELLA